MRRTYYFLLISFLSICQPMLSLQAGSVAHYVQNGPREGQHSSSVLSAQTRGAQEAKIAKKQSGTAATARESSPSDGSSSRGSDPRQAAMSLLELVLSGSSRITPVEFNILTQVEAASLLWLTDRERATGMLKSAVESMRQLRDRNPENVSSSRQRRLRFLAFVKIARLKPELVNELSLNSSNVDKFTRTVSGDWTDEARAIITIADEQIDKDPQLASKLAQQTMSLGQIDWAIFLRKLSVRDSVLSEQLASTVFDRLSSSSLTPISLLNLQRFVMSPERSDSLKERFFSALATRLRRDLLITVPSGEANDSLIVAEAALQLSANYPPWQPVFADIRSGLQELLTARSVAPTSPENRKMIPISMTDEIRPVDTQELIDSLPRLQGLPPSQAADLKRKELAVNAAVSGNLRLAEEVLPKIQDEALRRQTTVGVYGPFVKKAIRESDLISAREFAAKISDPLGRTLVLDHVSRSVQTNTPKAFVKETYELAAYKLRRDTATEDVAKAHLILAKSMSAVDPKESLESVSWAVYILNKLARNGELLDDDKIDEALVWWVNAPSSFRLQDEALDLTELIGTVFTDLAKRDAKVAQSVASDLLNQGLYSIAEMGVVRGMLQTAPSPAKSNSKR